MEPEEGTRSQAASRGSRADLLLFCRWPGALGGLGTESHRQFLEGSPGGGGGEGMQRGWASR